MSVQAINWVLNDAPDLPSNLVATLVALANHADATGRGAAPSQNRLARYTRKKPRTIRDDLAALESRGLIRRGDQRHVASLPADRRPVVYDLAMERHAHRPPEPSPTTADRPPDPVDEPVDNREAVHRRPAAYRRARTAPPGGPPPPVANAPNSANAGREAVHRRRTILEEEVTPPTSELLAEATSLLLALDHPWRVGRRTATALAPLTAAALAAGWTRETLAVHLAANPQGVRSYPAVLRARLADLPAPPRRRDILQPPPRRRLPAWCGECTPRSRMVPSPQHAGKFVTCPRCHAGHHGTAATQPSRSRHTLAPHPHGPSSTPGGAVEVARIAHAYTDIVERMPVARMVKT
jgi:hypothetical protein